MKILITEEALETPTGHFAAYVSTIAEGLRADGHEVDVLAHRDADPLVVKWTGAHPWFLRNCRTDVRSKGLMGFVSHNYSTWSDLKRWLDQRSHYDWVLQLATRRHHMAAFTMAALQKRYLPNGRFMMLFVHGFASYEGRDRPMVFRNTPASVLARLLFASMRPLVRSGRIVIAAETKAMQKELQCFTRYPVTLMPHPVKVDVSPAASDIKCTRSALPCPIVVNCPGFARYEKGSDLLLEAIKLLAQRGQVDGFRFVLQWLEPFGDPSGKIYAPDEELERGGFVKFVRQPLDEKSYSSLLNETHLMILPYRRSSYHNRVSRVATEAAAKGIPIIYMKDTWLDEVAEKVGSGVQIEDETVESVCASLMQAKQAYVQLRASAEMGAGSVQKYFSVRKMAENLRSIGNR